jgi:D-alanyl-D-alanine carboxypeptidase (penicillin-binding protein 5/6)
LIVVVNGLPSMQARADDPAALLDYGFNEFKAYTLFKPGDIVDHATTWEGVQPTVPLVVDRSVAVTLSFPERKGVTATVRMPETVKAPITVGQQVGTLVISAPGIENQEYPLKTGAAVDRLGFFSRIGMAAHYAFAGNPDTAKN